MSMEARSSSALFKRAEQLKRWEESDTNREPDVRKTTTSKKIKFSSGCVFLAASIAGDKDEVSALLDKGADIDTANVDGLTALHQACIDDNAEMVEFLVEHGADINRGDNEGWTPLHATASCGFLYIAKYLIEKGANVAAVNNDGELAIDIAENQKMKDFLRKEIEKKGIDCKAARSKEETDMLNDAKEWLATKSSSVNVPNPKNGATPLHVAAAKGYLDVMKVLFECGADLDAHDDDGWTPLHAAAHWGQREACQLLVENLADLDTKNYAGLTSFELADHGMIPFLEELKKLQNSEAVYKRRQAKKRTENVLDAETPSKVKKVDLQAKKIETPTSNDTIENNNQLNSSPNHELSSNFNEEVRLPPTVPLPKIEDSGEEFSSKDSIKESKKVHSPTKETKTINKKIPDAKIEVTVTNTKSNSISSEEKKEVVSEEDKPKIVPPPVVETPPTPPPPTTPPVVQVRRSFVPPVRDEESETQRKAHAKRVRETRRSTQGVTLEDIKSAEQLVKSNQLGSNNNETFGANGNPFNGVSVSATITTGTTTVPTRDTEEPVTLHERRPSWRLRVDNCGSKFKLEDATKTSEETTVTLPLHHFKSSEEKENDKENDSRNSQGTLATQAAIQRRRRPKRRSTGVVTFDSVDDLDKEPSKGESEEVSKSNHIHDSGSERTSRSRLSSSSDIRNENGEIDYKKLYEQQLLENDKLKDKLRKADEELRDTKQTLEKISLVTSKNSLSELEKRERRAMERKLSEMEEELKHMEILKSENQRLKDENGALIRVISKLSK